MNLRAFMIVWSGITAYYAARSAGKAKMMAARTIKDAFSVDIGTALKEMSCKRASEMDDKAFAVGKESHIPTNLYPHGKSNGEVGNGK